MAENKTDFLNPFDAGVSYEQFLKAKGSKSLEDYCKDKLTIEELAFLKSEIELINNK